jgi:hypothetical protein
MREDLFAELLESVREGGAILRGERRASRRFEYAEEDVRTIRERYALSQPPFAALASASQPFAIGSQGGDSPREVHACCFASSPVTPMRSWTWSVCGQRASNKALPPPAASERFGARPQRRVSGRGS